MPRNQRVPHSIGRSTVFTVRESMELLDFVMKSLDGISRNKAKGILAHGGITVNGRNITRHDHPLQNGDVVEVRRSPAMGVPSDSQYYTIVYEDPYLIVVDKQPGVLSMAVGAKSLNMKTLLDRHFALTHQRCTAHVVHRLDCRTSGLMLYAKRVDIQQAMQDGWHERVFDRRYVAVVDGVMQQPHGKVESWLKDNPRNYVVESSPTDNGGKFAVTHWRLLQTGRAKGRSLVELKLETGRKNQIRVHMADIGHPVLGDGKYGRQENPGSRMCLHAHKLAFYHPVSGRPLDFETPIPQQFINAVTSR